MKTSKILHIFLVVVALFAIAAAGKDNKKKGKDDEDVIEEDLEVEDTEADVQVEYGAQEVRAQDVAAQGVRYENTQQGQLDNVDEGVGCNPDKINYGNFSSIASYLTREFMYWDGYGGSPGSHWVYLTDVAMPWLYRSDMRVQVGDQRSTSINSPRCLTINKGDRRVDLEYCGCDQSGQIFFFLRLPGTDAFEYVLYHPENNEYDGSLVVYDTNSWSNGIKLDDRSRLEEANFWEEQDMSWIISTPGFFSNKNTKP